MTTRLGAWIMLIVFFVFALFYLAMFFDNQHLRQESESCHQLLSQMKYGGD